MKPVVLSGFMGTGKSTVGPRLAARLGIGFVDTDVEIERTSG
ncbi:MAG: shikimate kinase, partial [Myxococcota bacterium]|nr:shikimate kinase [Myxococcota bacterium]